MLDGVSLSCRGGTNKEKLRIGLHDVRHSIRSYERCGRAL
jgi:hypothetical protein